MTSGLDQRLQAHAGHLLRLRNCTVLEDVRESLKHLAIGQAAQIAIKTILPLPAQRAFLEDEDLTRCVAVLDLRDVMCAKLKKEFQVVGVVLPFSTTSLRTHTIQPPVRKSDVQAQASEV